MDNIYVFDIDGTLADNSHREHLVPSGENRRDTAAWAAFNAACVGDTPRQCLMSLAKTLIAAGKDVRFLTGRGQSANVETLTWLSAGLDMSRTLIPLRMRPMNDYSYAWEFKGGVLSTWLKENPGKTIIAFEDDPKIIANLKYLEPRVTFLQCKSLCSAVKVTA